MNISEKPIRHDEKRKKAANTLFLLLKGELVAADLVCFGLLVRLACSCSISLYGFNQCGDEGNVDGEMVERI